MWAAVVLFTLALPSQPEATGFTLEIVPPPPSPAALAAAAQPVVAAPERWLLMRELQGTYLGDLLDTNRIHISGWDELSYTASSDRRDNLPMGFDYRAQRFLLLQNWLRVDMLTVQTGTSEP